MKQTKLEKAILALNSTCILDEDRSHISSIDPRALLLVTAFYILLLLTVPLQNPGMLIWFAAYPIVTAPLAHESYGKIFRQSLWVLPLLIIIGIFNPLYDKDVAFRIGSINVSRGWISFISILIRGLLSLQALLLLVKTRGFSSFCESLRAIGLQNVLVTQLMMLYRYISVLLEEGLVMHRARIARGQAPSGYRMSRWGAFVGQLLLRSLDRSRRIHLAMKSRGFDGSFPISQNHRWNISDTVYCFIWIVVILALRTIDFSSLFDRIYTV